MSANLDFFLLPSFLVEAGRVQLLQALATPGGLLSAPSPPIVMDSTPWANINPSSFGRLFLLDIYNTNNKSTFGCDSSMEYKRLHSARYLHTYLSTWSGYQSGLSHMSPSPGLYNYISNSGLAMLNYFSSLQPLFFSSSQRPLAFSAPVSLLFQFSPLLQMVASPLSQFPCPSAASCLGLPHLLWFLPCQLVRPLKNGSYITY